MRQTLSALSGLLLLAGASFAAAAPAASGYQFPSYPHAGDLDRACAVTLAAATADRKRLERLPAGAPVLEVYDRMAQRVEDMMAPASLLSAVHPAKPLRSAAENCERRLTAFYTALQQNERIHKRLAAVVPRDDIDRRFQRDLLDAFEDAGVALPPAARKRSQAIARDLTRLAQAFDQRVREDKRTVAFTATELAGVPDGVWAKAPKDADGKYLLTLDSPTFLPVVQYAHDGTVRERMWRAVYTRGGDANLRTLDRIVGLRRELARLQGFDSFADFVLRRRMAHDGRSVATVLDQVQQAVAARELTDLEELRADKAAHLNQPDAVVQRWDAPYYTERVRRAKYNVDQEQFRAHFPAQASLDFVFRLATELFGVRFEAQPQTLWHPEARAYVVRDGDRYVGTLLVDMFPRADKYNHAAVWSLNSVSTLSGRTPAAALIVNFNRNGLDIDELETLLHEFGHALHSLLSTTRYALQGGTSTQLDFVEAPSQMLEDWVYDPKVVALFQQVCATCPPVPPELLARADAARSLGKGIQFARQRLYAGYDLALYSKDPVEPLALWQRMEGATPLGHVPGSLFPASFGHIASNYAAGYYGYLWSLVLAEDLRTAFAADRLSPVTGRRYRDTVLANGGQVSPDDMMKQFLGRPWNHDAFFTSLSRP